MLPIAPTTAAQPIVAAERPCCDQLGQRIAMLRESRCKTEAQLAERLGVAQQTIARYEAGRLRLLSGALPTLAEHLDTSIEDLLGNSGGRSRAGKRGPPPKIQQQLERLAQLPKAQQGFVSQMLDSMLWQAKR